MTTADKLAGQCPVQNFDMMAQKPAGTWWKTYDELRAQFPWYRNEHGDFWTMVNYDGILQVLQDPVTFSSSSVNAFDPDPPYRWIPEMLDGDEHKQWRRQLAPSFAPGTIERLTPKVRQRASDLVDGLVARGSCNFMADFAQLFPTSIFLDLMGLPLEELDQFMEWEHAILHSGSGNREAPMMASLMVLERFKRTIDERRAEPRDDLISRAIAYEVDGKPVSDEDLLMYCLLMFMAGLDTVSATLGWTFLHLARNDADRTAIVNDPALMPGAIEEFLRAYAIVIPARKVTTDVVVQGCPMKAGQMVSIPLSAATRDDTAFPGAMTVDIHRERNNHIAFGAGPHRCLGSHLARRELKIALEEWHKRIPNYRLAEGQELLETGGQLGLEALRLEW